MRAGLTAAGAAAMALVLLGAPCAVAQAGGDAASREGDPGGDTNSKPNQGSPLPGGGTTKDLTMPGQGGVADTGLGGSTNGSGNGATVGKTSGNTSAGLPGTGMSVKGPAGQGLDGRGGSAGAGAAATGSGSGSVGAGTAGAGK